MVAGVSHWINKLNRHHWGLWELRTLWIDFSFGGYAGGRVESRFSHLGAKAVQNLPYRVIKDVFDAIAVGNDEVLVDVGCGRGRVLNWWLHMGLRNRLIGIELDPQVAAQVTKRLQRYPNVKILAGDAVDLTPADTTIAFLFNPFDGHVVQKWHDALLARTTSTRLTIIYVNCIHLDVFERSGRWHISSIEKHPADVSEIAVIRRR